MTNPEIKNLLDSLSTLRKELTSLKLELNQLNEAKEKSFNEKNEYSRQIIALISEIKILKKERDEYTHKVKDFKQERGAVNSQIKPASEELNQLLAKKSEIKVKANPVALKKQIDELEYQI